MKVRKLVHQVHYIAWMFWQTRTKIGVQKTSGKVFYLCVVRNLCTPTLPKFRNPLFVTASKAVESTQRWLEGNFEFKQSIQIDSRLYDFVYYQMGESLNICAHWFQHSHPMKFSEDPSKYQFFCQFFNSTSWNKHKICSVLKTLKLLKIAKFLFCISLHISFSRIRILY